MRFREIQSQSNPQEINVTHLKDPESLKMIVSRDGTFTKVVSTEPNIRPIPSELAESINRGGERPMEFDTHTSEDQSEPVYLRRPLE